LGPSGSVTGGVLPTDWLTAGDWLGVLAGAGLGPWTPFETAWILGWLTKGSLPPRLVKTIDVTFAALKREAWWLSTTVSLPWAWETLTRSAPLLPWMTRVWPCRLTGLWLGTRRSCSRSTPSSTGRRALPARRAEALPKR